MIKVLCTSYLRPAAKSGVTTYYKALLQNFQLDPDVQITLVTVDDAGKFEKKIAGICRKLMHALFFFSREGLEQSFEVKNRLLMRFALRRFKNERFHLIHAQDILSGVVAYHYLSNKSPLILTGHYNDNPVEEAMSIFKMSETSRNRVLGRYLRKFAKVRAFIFVSNYAFNKSKFLLPPNADIHIIPNGVKFSQGHFQGRPARGASGKLSILNAGYIDTRKNQRAFIDIAKKLKAIGIHNFCITLVGDGPDVGQLKMKILEEKLSGHFDLAGWSNDATSFLSAADLYIHTALNDNCPYSVLEAIAKAVPVLGFNVGGMPEIVDDEYLFEPDETALMVQYIADNIHRLSEISKRQYGKTHERFSQENQLAATKSVYCAISAS